MLFTQFEKRKCHLITSHAIFQALIKRYSNDSRCPVPKFHSYEQKPARNCIRKITSILTENFVLQALLSTIAAQDFEDLIPKKGAHSFKELNAIEIEKTHDSTETDKSGRQQRIEVPIKPADDETNKLNETIQNEEMLPSSSQVMTSRRPYSQYEVTEKVIDIPNTRTPSGPIVPNYTLRPAINLAQQVTNTQNSAIQIDTSESPNTDENIQNKKNKFSILHVNAEFDDKPTDVHDNKVTGILRGIKEYLQNIHKGIYNGIHRFFHKQDENQGNRFKREAEREAVTVV